MKRKLLFIVTLTVIAYANKASAQTNASATWSLATNSNVIVTSTDPGAITATNQVLGAGITAITYGNSFDQDNPNGENQNWQRNSDKSAESSYAAAVATNFYSEYKITPATGKYFQVNSVSLSVVGIGGTTNRLAAYYSLDGFTTSNALATTKATYKTEGDPLTSTLYNATETEPVVLINVGNTNNADLEGREVLTFPNLQINVNPGQTLSVRLYYFQTGTGNRFTASKNVVISGKTHTSLIPLPLDFSSFTAAASTDFLKQVKLNWSTTNEVNTQKFIIERSTNGSFEAIGEVASNNISGINYYSFIDRNPTNETAYYRLKQIDKDGLFKYSVVTSVNYGLENILSAYPNPIVDIVNITHPKAHKDAVINIIDLNGRKVKIFKTNESSVLTTTDLSELGNGNFILTFDNGKEKSVIKIIKK